MGLNLSSKKLRKLINNSKKVFIMGHKNLDLDAIGSSIGMYSIVKKLKRECYIIIDDEEIEMGVSKVLKEVEGVYSIIRSSDIPVYLHRKSKKNLLIIVDTNKEELVQSSKSLTYFEKLVVIDHHSIGRGSIESGLIIIDDKASSASEMVVHIANNYDILFSPYECSLLLAAIVLDTFNFTLNTNSETFYIAYFLTAYGASTKKVQYLLKQDINNYVEQQKLLSNIEVCENVAITRGTQYVIYRREELARVADTLLFFNDIEVSFVIGKIAKDKVGISARSLGNFDVSKVMEKMSGGGDINQGAAVLSNMKISEVVALLKKILKEGE